MAQQQYDNTNRGVLFKNDRKEKDSHPEYKGSINVNGQEFWLSAWLKKGDKGTFMSLSVQPKDAQQSPSSRPTNQRAPAQQPRPEDDFGDEPPF